MCYEGGVVVVPTVSPPSWLSKTPTDEPSEPGKNASFNEVAAAPKATEAFWRVVTYGWTGVRENGQECLSVSVAEDYGFGYARWGTGEI